MDAAPVPLTTLSTTLSTGIVPPNALADVESPRKRLPDPAALRERERERENLREGGREREGDTRKKGMHRLPISSIFLF